MALPTQQRRTSDNPTPTTEDEQQQKYMIIIAGTHVVGKSAIGQELADYLHCPFLRCDPFQYSLHRISTRRQSQDERPEDIYGRLWLAKVERTGMLSPDARSISRAPVVERRGSSASTEDGQKRPSNTVLVCTMYALRRFHRDGIRQSLSQYGIKAVFVSLQITEKTLLGRFLGAETVEVRDVNFQAKKTDLDEAMQDDEIGVKVIDNEEGIEANIASIIDYVREETEIG